MPEQVFPNLENEKNKTEKLNSEEQEETFWTTHRKKVIAILDDPEKESQLKAREIAQLKKTYFLDRLSISLEDDRERFMTSSASWGKVNDVLVEGLISEAFANRIKKENYNTNYEYKEEMRDVYLGYGQNRPWSNVRPVFIVDQNIKSHYPENSLGGEKAARLRIAPRHILALILPATEDKKIKKLNLEKIKQLFKDHPDKALPIMTYKEGEEKMNGSSFPFFRCIPEEELYPENKLLDSK